MPAASAAANGSTPRASVWRAKSLQRPPISRRPSGQISTTCITAYVTPIAAAAATAPPWRTATT